MTLALLRSADVVSTAAHPLRVSSVASLREAGHDE